MGNELNNTDNVSNTQNPQESGIPTGANRAEDFQSPAEVDTLNSIATEELSVQDTGSSITNTPTVEADSLSFGWIILIIVSVVIAIIVVVRIIKEIIGEEVESKKTSPASKASPVAPKKTVAKAAPKKAKKVSRTGKKKTTKKSKKR